MTRLLTFVLALSIASSAAAEERTLCVYDPMGTNGPAYKNAESLALEAASQGVTFKLRADVEEKTAADDLVAGKCDAALVTGVSAREFGLASATVEAIGALPKYSWLKKTLAYLKLPELAKSMKKGDYETAGIYPAGRVLLYTKDKTWTNSADLAGKTIAVIGDDEAAATMVREVGSSPKTATTATFGNLYNSGSVDACYAPATAYEPLELYRGIGSQGGIIDFPLSQLTLQLIIRTDRFPEGFGQWGRVQAYSTYDRAIAMVQRAEEKVMKHLVPIPAGDKPGYDDKFLKVRLTLRSKGVYDKTILGLMRRVRCADDGDRAECADPQE